MKREQQRQTQAQEQIEMDYRNVYGNTCQVCKAFISYVAIDSFMDILAHQDTIFSRMEECSMNLFDLKSPLLRRSMIYDCVRPVFPLFSYWIRS